MRNGVPHMKTSLCANVQLNRSNFDFNLKSSLTPFFHRNLLFCAIQRTPIPSSFGSSLLELPHLFSPFKWCILIRIMSKTLLKIVAYNNQSGHHFSSRDLVQPTTTKILQNCKKVPYRPVLNISRAWFKICAWHSFERSSYFLFAVF